MNFALTWLGSALAITLSFYLSVRVLDSANTENTWGLAALIGVVFGFAGALGFGFLALVPLLIILVSHYDLGLLGTESARIALAEAFADLAFSTYLVSFELVIQLHLQTAHQEQPTVHPQVRWSIRTQRK